MKIYVQRIMPSLRFKSIKIVFPLSHLTLTDRGKYSYYCIASDNIFYSSYFIIFYSYLTAIIEDKLNYNRDLTTLGFDISFLTDCDYNESIFETK